MSSDTTEVLSQLNLFAPTLAKEEEENQEDWSVEKRRPRSYDDAVLNFVHYFHWVTVQQLIYRFFIYRGKGPEYGFRLIRDLVKRGFLEKGNLEPEKGNASQEVVTLTAAGYEKLGIEQPRVIRSTVLNPRKLYQVQWADSFIELSKNGWMLVPKDRKFKVLSTWAKGNYRGRMLNETERMVRDRIDKLEKYELELDVLYHRSEKNFKFIFPVYTGKSYKTTIENLPDFHFYPPLHFMVVSAEPELASRATDQLKKWGKKLRGGFSCEGCEPFQRRKHPRKADDEKINFYKKHSVLDPLETRI